MSRSSVFNSCFSFWEEVEWFLMSILCHLLPKTVFLTFPVGHLHALNVPIFYLLTACVLRAVVTKA